MFSTPFPNLFTSGTDPCKELLVAIGASDRGRDEAAPGEAVFFGDEAADLFNRPLVELGIADDAALGDVLALELELGLDEGDDAPLFVEHGKDGGQDFGERDEGEVHDGEADFFADVLGLHVAGVELLFDDDAGIGAQFPDEVVGADVHGVDTGGTALEQAIGETAGGGSDVDAGPAGGIDVEGVERGFELEAAAADEAGFFLHLQRRVEGELVAGLGEGEVSGTDLAGEAEALCLLAGVAEAAGYEQGVGAFGFHGAEANQGGAGGTRGIAGR